MTQSLINVSTVTTTSLVTYLAVIDIHLKPNHVHNTCNEWVQRDASEMTGPPGLPTGGSPVSSPSLLSSMSVFVPVEEKKIHGDFCQTDCLIRSQLRLANIYANEK